MVAVQLAPQRNEPAFAVSVARDGAVRDFVMLPPIRAGLNGDQEQVRAVRCCGGHCCGVGWFWVLKGRVKSMDWVWVKLLLSFLSFLHSVWLVVADPT